MLPARRWHNASITESQISDLIHTTDTNESTRFNSLVSSDCAAGNLVIGVQADGTVLCATDAGNSSWNESHADTLYAGISVTGDNSSWNESHADTLYAGISVTGDPAK